MRINQIERDTLKYINHRFLSKFDASEEKFGIISIALMAVISLSGTAGVVYVGSAAAYQSTAHASNATNFANSKLFSGTLVLTMSKGIIVPTNCLTLRSEVCIDYKRGLVYVSVNNGTLFENPFRQFPYTIRSGIVVLPLNETRPFGLPFK